MSVRPVSYVTTWQYLGKKPHLAETLFVTSCAPPPVPPCLPQEYFSPPLYIPVLLPPPCPASTGRERKEQLLTLLTALGVHFIFEPVLPRGLSLLRLYPSQLKGPQIYRGDRLTCVHLLVMTFTVGSCSLPSPVFRKPLSSLTSSPETTVGKAPGPLHIREKKEKPG